MKQTVALKLSLTMVLTASLFGQVDPGPRIGIAPPARPLDGLTAGERRAFDSGLDAFSEVDGVDGGLGPRFNLDSCAGCHAHPAIGGASPRVNPQIAVASKMGAMNRVPPFIQ